MSGYFIILAPKNHGLKKQKAEMIIHFGFGENTGMNILKFMNPEPQKATNKYLDFDAHSLDL